MATFVNDAIGGNSPFSSGGGVGAIPFGVPVGGGNFGGDGMNGLLGIAALGLLFGNNGFGGNRRGNDCDNDSNAPFIAAILNNLNNSATSIPTTALETQGTITSGLASLALGVQQGFANVKDSVQISGTANLLATKDVATQVATTALQTVIAIGNDGDKTRAQLALYHEADLQRQLGVAQSALLEERSHGRIREVEVNVSQTVNQQQVQAQAQLQQQQQAQFLAGILAEVRNLAGDVQAVKQGQVIFNSGTMAASGTQAAANTKVA